MSSAPLILDIKGNALDDGPGIRSVVFFKGCLLTCDWCHNPESMSKAQELSFEAKKCLGAEDCNANCIAICPVQAISRAQPLVINREQCTLCHHCVEVCPANALTWVGTVMSVDEVFQRLENYQSFYQTSGGGVTLSGGEPTLHMAFVSQLLQKLKSKGIHTLLQTCGLFSFDKFMSLLYPWLDSVYFDLKLFNEQQHRHYCGASNKTILNNFVKLHDLSLAGGVKVLARIPLVPGITDTESNLQALARFLKQHLVVQIALLHYNPLWPEKRKQLGYQAARKNHPLLHQWVNQVQIERCKQIFRETGLSLV